MKYYHNVKDYGDTIFLYSLLMRLHHRINDEPVEY